MTAGSIFDRVARLEAALADLPDPALVASLGAELAQARHVIVAQGALIRDLAGRLPLDPALQETIGGVEVATDPQRPPLAMGEAQAMLATVQPILDRTGVTLAGLRSPRKPQALVEVRWAAMRALAEAGYSRDLIARFLRRDVSTVAHGLRGLRGLRGVG